MEGKEKFLQMLGEDEEMLEKIARYVLNCPYTNSLSEDCESCYKCWCEALLTEKQS